MHAVDYKEELKLLNTMEDDVVSLRRGILHDPIISGYVPRVRQWILRLLCDCGLLAIDHSRLDSVLESFADVLKIDWDLLVNSGFGNHASDPDLVAALRAARREMSSAPAPVSGQLNENLRRLAQSLEMSQVECDILALTLIARGDGSLAWLLDNAFEKTDPGRLVWQLSQVLGYRREEIEPAISSKGLLMQAGLMRIDHHSTGGCMSVVLQLNSYLTSQLTRQGFDADVLLRSAASPVAPTALVMDDFEFLGQARELALRFLRGLRKGDHKAGSILLDGPPGVGKSEFARVLLQEAGLEGFGVNELDGDDDPSGPVERMQYLRMSQRLVSRRADGLIIFDEADSLFQWASGASNSRFGHGRASVLQLLENLEVPVIWITNHGDTVHPAIQRRIDLTVRFPELPASVRERMLVDALHDQEADPDWLAEASGNPAVTPARIAQAEHVVRVIGADEEADQAQVFQQVLEQNVLSRVRKPGKSARKGSSPFELPYRPELINADQDLGRITESLKGWRQGRLCLYGPPGSGKTRYVHHLAAKCGLKVVEYRASDVLDKYLGESEKAIRRMFASCDRECELLFLDEADSLIRSRESAQRSWEVSQTNELLKSLEHFDGLFVASTNLFGELDTAVMRRLDFRLHFGYMKPEQRWRLFLDLARHLDVRVRGASATRARRVLDRADCLTPGDFAMLARRLTFDPAARSGPELAELMLQESMRKPDAARSARIGFTADLSRRSPSSIHLQTKGPKQ